VQLVPTKWTSGALVLIFTSLMLYLFVVVAERGDSTEAGEKPHREAGEKPRTGMGESRDTLFALDLDTLGEKPGTEMGEHGETLLGIDLDSPFMVTAVVAMWSLIALGLVWQVRWALAGGIGWAALSVLGDAFELVGKAAEVNWGLFVAVLAVGVMHVGVGYMCFQALRQGSQPL